MQISYLSSRSLAALALIASMLGGCATQQHTYESVEYHSNKALESQAGQQFEGCRTESLALDAAANQSGDAAQFSLTARTIDTCLAEIEPHQKVVPLEERMQLHAVGVASYYKAGELEKARAQLEAFELVYRGRDLYFSDSTSFLDTFRLLLGELPPSASAKNSLVNARGEVKAEVRRQLYWKNH